MSYGLKIKGVFVTAAAQLTNGGKWKSDLVEHKTSSDVEDEHSEGQGFRFQSWMCFWIRVSQVFVSCDPILNPLKSNESLESFHISGQHSLLLYSVFRSISGATRVHEIVIFLSDFDLVSKLDFLITNINTIISQSGSRLTHSPTSKDYTINQI